MKRQHPPVCQRSKGIDSGLVYGCYDPDEIQAVRDSLEADTASHQSVEWRMDCNLEQYFPALAESFPTKRCSRLANRNQ